MRVWRIMPSLFVVCLSASTNTVWADELFGIWPTCWEPWAVEKAEAAANRGDLVEWRTMKCGMLGDSGTRVRVIRCAADVTRARTGRFSHPVPSDDSLPAGICEVELFYQEGGTGIHYTNSLNIEKTP